MTSILSNSTRNPSKENEDIRSEIIEDLIETSLEHFAIDDATVLAESYHSRVGSERSLLILARCLTRPQNPEGAYNLLKMTDVGNLKTAKSRYLFAFSAFQLNRLQEAEYTLRDEKVIDKIELHPSFKNAASLPYAHALLAMILCETNRVDCAKTHWASSIQQCPFLWSSLHSYCEIGAKNIKDHLQQIITLLSNMELHKKQIKSSDRQGGKEASSAIKMKPNVERISLEKRKSRLRNIESNCNSFLSNNTISTALRASENSPFTRTPKINSEESFKNSMFAPLIESKQKEDEQALLSNKRITRRAAAAAAAASNTKAKIIELPPFSEQGQSVDFLYYEMAEWFFQLAEVQEHLSHFRCSTALQLINKLNPFLSQLPLSLELRARIFFENGEYKRSCEIFEEIRRIYPRRINGMEIYSTALWQLHDSRKLSALASKMVEIARDRPQTWCVAANCFSIEKQHETAIECLERAIRLDHRFTYAYSLLGHELIDMNDMNRAAQAFRKAIQFSPNDYRAWYGLGLVNFKEQLQMARINLLRAVNINPNNTVLLCQLAVIEQSLHNTDSAMRYLECALKYSPNNVPCRFHKARLYFDTGNYEAARKELEELRVLSPDEAHVFFLLGRVNRKLGNTHMALLNFSWATEIDPRGEQNQSALTQDKGPYDDEPI